MGLEAADWAELVHLSKSGTPALSVQGYTPEKT